MASYTAIPDADIDADSPLTTTLGTLLRDNPIAITEGAAGAPNIVAAAIATDAVEEAKIKNGAVTEGKLATNSVTNTKIGNFAVDTAELATGAVETDKINALAVTAAKLGPLAVETAKIDNLAVTEGKISGGAVTAVKLGSQSVETTKIKLLNVTAALLATDAVETTKIKDGNVTRDKLAIGVAKVIFSDITEVGNVGAGEDDLMSFTMAANQMAGSGYSLRITAFFKGNGADNVTLKFHFGGTSANIRTGAPFSNTNFYLRVVVDIVRVAASAQRFAILAHTSSGPTYGGTTSGEAHSGTIVVKFTGTNTTDASNDAVTQQYMKVEHIPS